MRLLGRLRERADGGKIIILPVVLGLLLGPEGLHRHDGLLGLRPAVREVASHDLRLLFEPACCYTKEKPATGEVIERGDLLGQEEWVALRDQTNPCPELDRLRHRRGPRQADEGVNQVSIERRDGTAQGKGRDGRHRHNRVLREPKGIKAQLLSSLRQYSWVNGIGGGEIMKNAHFHRCLLVCSPG